MAVIFLRFFHIFVDFCPFVRNFCHSLPVFFLAISLSFYWQHIVNFAFCFNFSLFSYLLFIFDLVFSPYWYLSILTIFLPVFFFFKFSAIFCCLFWLGCSASNSGHSISFPRNFSVDFFFFSFCQVQFFSIISQHLEYFLRHFELLLEILDGLIFSVGLTTAFFIFRNCVRFSFASIKSINFSALKIF